MHLQTVQVSFSLSKLYELHNRSADFSKRKLKTECVHDDSLIGIMQHRGRGRDKFLLPV